MLADGIEVKGAMLDNGLLHIDMVRVTPESTARKIEISSGRSNGAKQLTNGSSHENAIDVEVTDGKAKKPRK